MVEYEDVTSLKKQIADFKKSVKSSNSDYLTAYLSALSAVEGMIADLPTADVAEVKHGEWSHLGGDEWFCTKCGKVISTEGSWEKPTEKYCSECGAKMDGLTRKQV